MLSRGARDYENHSKRKKANDPISMLDYYIGASSDIDHNHRHHMLAYEDSSSQQSHGDRWTKRDYGDLRSNSKPHSSSSSQVADINESPDFRQGWHWRHLLHSGKHRRSSDEAHQVGFEAGELCGRESSMLAGGATGRSRLGHGAKSYQDHINKRRNKTKVSTSPLGNDSSGYGEGTFSSLRKLTNKTHPIEEPVAYKNDSIIPVRRSNPNANLVANSNHHHYNQANKSLNFDANLAHDDDSSSETRARHNTKHLLAGGMSRKLDTKTIPIAISRRQSIGGHRAMPASQRLSRHRRSHYNQNYYTIDDPYALSELFSQSEIPGFREIFASDSYLRKFCWIVAFLIFTILSLNDMTELLTEYYDYPITVDLRHRDSSRLPFPAVTVCNLNVVKFSALCSSGTNRLNLTNQIPSELRDKLCGIQVDKSDRDKPESDISDINNIGMSSSTSTTTSSTIETSSTTMAASSTGSDTLQGSLDGTTRSSLENQPDPTRPNGPDEDSSVKRFNKSSAIDRPEHRTLKQQYANGRLGAPNRKRIATRSIKPSDRADQHPFGDGPRQVDHLMSSSSLGAGPHHTRLGQLSASGAGVNQDTQAINLNNNNNNRGYLPMGNQAAKSRPAYTGSSGSSISGNAGSIVVNRNGLTVNSASSGSFLPGQTQSFSSTTSTSTTTFAPPALPDDFELTERQERELQENMTNWLAVMYNRDPELTESLGHQFGDMILRCTMKSSNCTHPRSFEYHFTPTEGNCFTYKARLKRRGGQGRSQYEEANLAGTNHGLELVLNLEKNEYISGSSQVGALIMIHHPGDLGYAASESIFVAPEHTTYIGLKMVNITRLPAPYPEYCVDSWPAKFAANLTRNSTYSQQACIKICLQQTIQQRCSCQSALLPQVEIDANLRVIICDTRKRQTRQCVEEVMFRAADKVNNCDCPPKCQVIRYDKTVSMAKWPTREDRVTFDRGKADINFQNLAKIIVYFQTMTCEEVTQQAVFNAAKLFSALGGIMGMYVGFSFLSVFEIFEVMSRKLWHHSTMKFASISSR